MRRYSAGKKTLTASDPHGEGMGFLEASRKYFEKAAAVCGLDASGIETLSHPRVVFKFAFPFRDDHGDMHTMHGYRAQHTHHKLPCKGGIRLDEAVDLEETRAWRGTAKCASVVAAKCASWKRRCSWAAVERHPRSSPRTSDKRDRDSDRRNKAMRQKLERCASCACLRGRNRSTKHATLASNSASDSAHHAASSSSGARHQCHDESQRLRRSAHSNVTSAADSATNGATPSTALYSATWPKYRFKLKPTSLGGAKEAQAVSRKTQR